MVIAAVAHHPVGQHGNATVAGHQQHDDGGQLDLADCARLDPRRPQQQRKDIEARLVHGIGDQRLVGEIRGLDPGLVGQRVTGCGDEHGLIVEQRGKGDVVEVFGVGRDHEIDFLALQGG